VKRRKGQTVQNVENAEWTQGTFRRDTLVHSLGRLAEVVLQAAFHDDSFCERYCTWQIECDESEKKSSQVSLPLLFTGLKKGELAVLARDRDDEFFVKLTHPNFSALIAIAFERNAERSSATWVAQFDGTMLEAIHFANDLADQVRLRRSQGAGLQSPQMHSSVLN
jgi:hypothetical protein